MKLLERLTKKTEKSAGERRETLARQCTELTERLADVRANFDYVTDAAAMDALIFEENAILCRLEQLYRDAREQGVTVEYHERKK